MSFRIFQNEKTPFQAKKTGSSKSLKIDIFPKGLTHAFGPKMAIFPTSFFLGNIDQENAFYDIQQRKNAFLDYKNNNFKKSKNSHFSKGVNPCFWSKNDHISNFFFQVIEAWKMIFTIFQNNKKAFLGQKNNKFKKSKNGHLSNFLFQAI